MSLPFLVYKLSRNKPKLFFLIKLEAHKDCVVTNVFKKMYLKISKNTKYLQIQIKKHLNANTKYTKINALKYKYKIQYLYFKYVFVF